MANPQAAPSPSDPYFEGLTYGRAWNAFWLGVVALFCWHAVHVDRGQAPV